MAEAQNQMLSILSNTEPKNKMRVFVAVHIPKQFQKEIKNIQERIPEFKGKFTELKNLHLTLKFLGDIDEKKSELVKEKLRNIKIKEFESVIDKIGFFDNRRSTKYPQQIVIWLHMANCEKLQKDVDEKLSDLFEKEKRFMGHLTIARVKTVKNKKDFLEELEKINPPKMKFEVKDFRLKKSTLSKNGPVYEDLEIYSLEQ